MITLMTLHHGNYGISLIMGNAGFVSFMVLRASQFSKRWTFCAFIVFGLVGRGALVIRCRDQDRAYGRELAV